MNRKATWIFLAALFAVDAFLATNLDLARKPASATAQAASERDLRAAHPCRPDRKVQGAKAHRGLQFPYALKPVGPAQDLHSLRPLLISSRSEAGKNFDPLGKFLCRNDRETPTLEVEQVFLFKPSANGRRKVRVWYFDGRKVDYPDACATIFLDGRSVGIRCDNFNGYGLGIGFLTAAKSRRKPKRIWLDGILRGGWGGSDFLNCYAKER